MSEGAKIHPVAELIRFNPSRARRGVGAAEVRIGADVLWMTQADLRNNIQLFGPLHAFLLAQHHYKTRETYP